jgi:Carboxypeptidase regulatory-like domain
MRLVALFLLGSAAFAQSGGISGIVSDAYRAPIAKTAIQAKNSATGVTYRAESAADGRYTLSQLPAGTYEITAGAPGLVPFRQQKLAVESGKTSRVDIHLDDVQVNTLGEDRDFYTRLAGPHDAPSGPTPRMPDGKPDLSGMWLASFPKDPGNPEPLPWAAALIKQRQATQNKDIPSSRCLPLGVVMSTFLFPYKFVQTPRLLVMLYEGEFPRQVYLDGRAHPKDPNPSWLGHSIGHWEGDTLVVDTVGFNGKAWVGFGGLPATEMLHVVERYRRPDLGHLEYEITVDDPGAYVKPWTMKKASELSRDDNLMEYICNENERDLSHLGK